MISSRTTGLEGVFDKIRSITEAFRVLCGDTVSGYRQDGKLRKNMRTTANALIVNAQAKQGRNPFFLDSAEDAVGNAMVASIIDAWQNGQPQRVMSIAKELATMIAEAAKKHIEQGRSVDGPMKPISERWKLIKERVFHKPDGLPILECKGLLKGSIAPSVRTRGGAR